MKGLKLLWLPLFAAAAISLACSQEVSPPETPATSGTDAPTAAAITDPPTAEPAAVASTPAAITTETPASTVTETPMPATATKGAPGTGDGSESLVVLASRSTTAPSRLGPEGVAGLRLSPVPQTMAGEGSLTVSAIGTVTVAPDEAYVVVIPELDYGISGPEQLSAEDRQDIVANLGAVGVSEEAIEFEHMFRYEPAVISVEVAVDEFTDAGDVIVGAIEKVVRRSESSGMRFGLSEENCDRAVSLARREAIPEAEAAADDLADALGLRRGEVIGTLEYPLQSVPYGYGPLGSDLATCAGQDAYGYRPLLPFDADPEVEVSVGLQVSYGIR